MKIIYCNHSVYNPGGMERVMLNKIRWMVERLGWEVMIVTTDQKGRPPFYPVPEGVRMVDLGINYSDDNDKHPLRKIAGYLRRRRLHKKRLTQLLMRERADVVVSLYPSESSFIPDIPDGSRKVLELHFCKFFRLQYGRHGLLGWIDRRRTRQDEDIVRRFDRFVVLTREDRGYWGQMPNITVIPNAALPMGEHRSTGERKRIIAVGRLDYQKGFDRLLQAWQLVQRTGRYGEWRLDIFGQGEWRGMLENFIRDNGMEATACVNAPTKDIAREYAESAMLVMSSHYEGFPMVMIEAMACGLPVVAFDFKCGPKDIVRDGRNGILVPNDDIAALAQGMMRMMDDDDARRRMSDEARKVVDEYSEARVMGMWKELFEDLVPAGNRDETDKGCTIN